MLKDLLEKGKCLIGLHHGDWTFLKENNCTSVRVCVRCGTQSRKTEHSWSSWNHTKEQDCCQERCCQRCRCVENRVVHQWQQPTFKEVDRCEMVQICARCGVEQAAYVSHTWTQWEYVSEDDCSQTQICERCGDRGGEKRIEHNWGEWQHSEQYGGAVRVCKRCGELTLPREGRNSVHEAAVPPITNTPVAHHVDEFIGSSADKVKSQMLELLKPKMNQLSEMMNVMENILGHMEGQTAQQFSEVGDNSRSSPPALSVDGSSGFHDQAERDVRLVGQWRFTDARSSGGVSQATDYFRLLGSDGGFIDRSHSCGSFGESWSDPEYGRWATSNKTLYLYYNDGNERTYSYYLEDNTLFFPEAGFQRLWERIG